MPLLSAHAMTFWIVKRIPLSTRQQRSIPTIVPSNTLRMLFTTPRRLNRFSGGALLGAATDDACFAIESSNIQQFNNGSWNALSNPDNVWDRYFAGIAKCCTIIGEFQSY